VRGELGAGDRYEDDPGADVFHNDTLASMLFDAWVYVATRYRNVDNILAYEILSEPRDKDATASQVRDFYSKGCAAVHAVDAATPCLVGPGSYYKLWLLNEDVIIDDPNTIYTFDYFEPSAFVFGDGAVDAYPGSYACKDLYAGWATECCPEGAAANTTFDRTWHARNFANWAGALRASADVPLFVNQWSVVHGVADSAGRRAYVEDVADLLQQHDIGWAWWVWRGGGGDDWTHGSSELLYYAANGTLLVDSDIIAALAPYMSDSDDARRVR